MARPGFMWKRSRIHDRLLWFPDRRPVVHPPEMCRRKPVTRRHAGPELDPEVSGVPEGVLVSGQPRGTASCGEAHSGQRSSVEMEAVRGDQRRMEARGGGIRVFREEVRIIRLPDRSPRGEGLL